MTWRLVMSSGPRVHALAPEKDQTHGAAICQGKPTFRGPGWRDAEPGAAVTCATCLQRLAIRTGQQPPAPNPRRKVQPARVSVRGGRTELARLRVAHALTLQDVGKLAGLHYVTVNHAELGRPGVRPETVERIRAVLLAYRKTIVPAD